MKIRMMVVIAVLSAMSGYLTAPAWGAEASRMEKDALQVRLGQPDVVVIDVRAVTDWLLTKEKIKGAVRENPKDFAQWYGNYPKEKTIILYCA